MNLLAHNFASLCIVLVVVAVLWAWCVAIRQYWIARAERKHVEVMSEDLDLPKKRVRQHHVDGG